jgi:hypothetical protein
VPNDEPNTYMTVKDSQTECNSTSSLGGREKGHIQLSTGNMLKRYVGPMQDSEHLVIDNDGTKTLPLVCQGPTLLCQRILIIT